MGITQIIDSVGLAASEEAGNAAKIVSFIFDLMAAGVFVLFGVLASKGYGGAFIVGMIVYALDGMLFLLVKDFLSIGFHVFALFFIYVGYSAYKKLKSMGTISPA